MTSAVSEGGDDEVRALLRQAIVASAQHMASITLTLGLSIPERRDESGGRPSRAGGERPVGVEVDREAITGALRAARAALVELRLVTRILDLGDRPGADHPALPDRGWREDLSPTVIVSQLAARVRADGMECTVDVPSEVDDLPETVRTSVSRVLSTVVELVPRSGLPRDHVLVWVRLEHGVVDLTVEMGSGLAVDPDVATSVLAGVARRVRLSGGAVETTEPGGEPTSPWRLRAWLRC